MNARATRYAWLVSHVVGERELVTVAVRAFLLALAYRIPEGPCCDTAPTTLDEFEQMTTVSERHLRAVRNFLVQVGELQQGGDGAPVRTGKKDDAAPPWPKRAIYSLTGLAGPLFRVVTPWDVDENSELSSELLGPKSELSSGLPTQSRNSVPGFRLAKSELSSELRRKSELSSGQSRNSVPRFGRSAGGVLSSREVRTSDLLSTSHDDDGAMVANLAKAHAFLDRWCAEFGAFNNGASYRLNVEQELPLVLELVAAHGSDRLWQMSRALWSASPDGDRRLRSLAGLDGSIRLLHRAENTLAQVVARPASSAASSPKARVCRYKHEPPCVTDVVCAERERQRIAAEDGLEAVAQ